MIRASLAAVLLASTFAGGMPAGLDDGHSYLVIDEDEIAYTLAALPNGTGHAVVQFLYAIAAATPVPMAWNDLIDDLPVPTFCYGFSVAHFPPGFVQLPDDTQAWEMKVSGAGNEFTSGPGGPDPEFKVGLGYYWAYSNTTGGPCVPI